MHTAPLVSYEKRLHRRRFAVCKNDINSFICSDTTEMALSDAQDAVQAETEKLERSQNELAQSKKNIKMRTEELRVSELALLDSNQKLARMNEDLVIAINDLASLKKTSEAELEGKDVQIKIADDLLF